MPHGIVSGALCSVATDSVDILFDDQIAPLGSHLAEIGDCRAEFPGSDPGEDPQIEGGGFKKGDSKCIYIS
jgi:hypothetical protein